MLTLDLNLASRPFKNDTLPWVGLGVAVVALTLLTLWNVRSYRQNTRWVEDLKQQYSATRDELDQFDLRERGAQREIEGYDLAALHVRADKANEVIRWKAFSWTRLFNLLQEVLPNDVQMIGIRPIFRPQGVEQLLEDPTAGWVPVSVEGASKGYAPFLTFERELLAHPSFDHVEPEGHTQSRTGSLAFQLQFFYDPEVAEKREEELVAAGSAALVEGPDDAADEDDPPADERGEGAATEEPATPLADGSAVEAQADRAGEPAAAGEGRPPVSAEAGKKRPTPPTSRRRGRRPDSADDEQEGGR